MRNIMGGIFRYAAVIVGWLIEPPAGLEENIRRRLKLLSAFLFLFVINTLWGSIFLKHAGDTLWIPMAITSFICMIGYGFSRTKYYFAAIVIAVSITAFPSVYAFLFSTDQAYTAATLMWLTLPLLISSLLLSIRLTIIIGISYVVLLIAIAPFSIIDSASLSQMFAFLSMIFFLVIVTAAIRRHDQSEIELQFGERLNAEKILRESEEKFKSLFEYSKDAIVIADAENGIIVDINPAGCSLLGLSKDDIVGRHQSTIHPPELAEEYKNIFRQHVEKGRVITEDIIVQRADGSRIQTDISASVIKMGDRTIIQGVFRDITERKRMQKALENEVTWRRILIEQSRDGIVILEQNGGVYEANRRFAEMLGYSHEEVLKIHVWDWEYQIPPEQVKEMISTVTEEGDHFETRHRRKDGTTFEVEISTNGATFAGHKLIFCVCRDITERKKTEEALKTNEERFRLITDNSTDLISRIQLGPPIKTDYTSPSCLRITGYKQEEFYANPNLGLEMIHPEDREFFQKSVNPNKKSGQKPITVRLVRKDGQIVWIEQTHTVIYNELGELVALHLIAHDITDRRRSEQALKESEDKFSRAFRTSPNTMAISTLKEGKFIEVNDSFTIITGYTREEAIGHSSSEINIWARVKDRNRMLQLLKKNGKVDAEEFEFRMKSGEIRTWLFSAEKINIGGEACLISITTDITERKRAEKLQHDENYVLTLLGQGVELNELLDAIVLLGESHNPSIKGSMLLYDPEKECLMQASGPNLPTDYQKLLESGVPIGPEMGSCGTAAHSKKRVIVENIANSPLFTQEEVVKGANDNGLYACWSQPIIASDGEVLGTIANYSNKTGEPDAGDIRVLEWSARIAAIAIERKQAEKALRESEEKFSVAFRASPQQVIITRIKDDITLDVNDSFTRATGFTREETIGHPATELDIWLNPGDRERMLRVVNEQGRLYNEEFDFCKKSGEIHTNLLSVEKVNIGGDECLLSILTDITERKEMEKTLRFSDAAFKSIHESVIVTNLEGEITLWNEISEQLFGLKAYEVMGKKFLEVVEVVETYSGEKQDRIKNIQDQGHWEDERLYRTRKGDIWVDVHLQDIVGNGKHYGRVMLASDITQRKQAEAELKRALAELEESNAKLAATNKELEAFSYSVSHDLRSPLRSIDGFSQALLEDYEGKLDETGQDYLNRLRGASQKMGELIDGMLKLSRLTRSEMHQETVDLSALAEEIAGRLRETHPERRAKFIIEKGLSAEGDPQLLRALFENLLSNAWKFTRNKPEAKIEFRLDHNGSSKAYFIRDNGAGFDMTYSDKLFGAFQRLHDANEFPGTGIGLATVQRIIHRHGGTVRAEGAVGKGATFYFTLN